MGVPRLFPFTKNTFKKSIRYFRHGQYKQSVDHLMVDANCLLHAACQEVYHYGANNSPIDRYAKMTDDEKLRKVCDLFFESLKDIVSTIEPKKVLYLTLDGPAPLAKQAQQRQRRFVSARTRLEASIDKFDSNSITPGTIFMHEVTKYLNYAIRQEMNTNWMNFTVHFSPCTVPGEGEHKLMDYIRSLPLMSQNFDSFCMFGPDGDLIMLTLSAHVPNMFLFREDQYNLGHYHLLDMGKIREQMPRLFSSKLTRNLDILVDEFVFLGFFVGNDFLPKVQMFHLLEDGLGMMLKTHSSIGKMITKKSKINFEGIKDFVREISKSEYKFIQDQSTTDPSVRNGAKFRNNTLFSHMAKGELDMKGYRTSYYLKSNISTEEGIQIMCKDYFKTLVWVFKYYVIGLPAWRWLYPWHYAPLMTDLSDTLDNLSEEDFITLTTFTQENASLPFVQLLSVLPATSKELLPSPYKELFEEGELVDSGMYPSDFSIDYEGVFKEYQGIALLPFVEYDTIYNAYYNQFTKEEYNRNKIGNNSIFSYDKDYKGRITTDYGTIYPLKVRKISANPFRV